MDISNLSLDTLALQWLDHLDTKREEISARLSVEISSNISAASTNLQPTTEQIQKIIRRTVWPFVTNEVLSECATWLSTALHRSAQLDIPAMRSTLSDASTLVPFVFLETSPPRLVINPNSWIIPSVLGGIVGGLLLPISYFGALLGSAGAIAGLAWLIRQPDIRFGFTDPNLVSEFDAASKQAKFKQRRHINLVQNMLFKLGRKCVQLLLRPEYSDRPSTSLLELRQAIENDYANCALFVLTMCWSQFISNSPKKENYSSLPLQDKNLYELIGILDETFNKNPNDLEQIQELALQLVQNMRDEGYIWKSVPNGELYSNSMRRDFENFGHLEEGQPVKTLKKALCYQDQVVITGVLTRIRGS